MKFLTRSAIALVFLIGLATPLLAVNPDVAVRISPPNGTCFTVSLKNLGPLTTVNLADLSVYDPKTCKRLCFSEMKVMKALKPCETMTFTICCKAHLVGFISRVRVHHNFGINEQWAY
jgi:hypothetical protein